MSEEEKKDIEYLKKYIEWETYGERSLENAIATILNLFEKQQKEIEELNTEIHKRDMRIKELEEVNNCLHETNNDYISKDKIRNKIVECNEEIRTNNNDEIGAIFTIKKLQILEELLGE